MRRIQATKLAIVMMVVILISFSHVFSSRFSGSELFPLYSWGFFSRAARSIEMYSVRIKRVDAWILPTPEDFVRWGRGEFADGTRLIFIYLSPFKKSESSGNTREQFSSRI